MDSGAAEDAFSRHLAGDEAACEDLTQHSACGCVLG